MYRKQYSLSIIVPVYREENSIRRCITESILFFDRNPYVKDYELIFVADKSGDTTIEIIKAVLPNHLKIRLIVNEKRLEKGGSIRVGMLQTHLKGLYLFYDTDLSTPLNEFNKLIRQIECFDIAIGSRHIRGAQVDKSLLKTIISKTLTLINIAVLGLSIQDTQCGFKLFNHKASGLFKSMTIASSAFDIELLYMAKKAGLKVKEIPVVWRDSEASNFNHIAVVAHFIRDLIRIRFNSMRGMYPSFLK